MNRKMMILVLALASLAAACLLAPAPASAQVDFGVRGGFYSDADAGFLGGELLFGLTHQWFLNPNFEYVFVDRGDLATLNLDVHYDLPTRAPYYLWLGGGPALVFRDDGRRNSDSETDLGVDLLAGIGFGKGQAIRPYVQGKVLISDETEAAIAFGLRFH